MHWVESGTTVSDTCYSISQGVNVGDIAHVSPDDDTEQIIHSVDVGNVPHTNPNDDRARLQNVSSQTQP